MIDKAAPKAKKPKADAKPKVPGPKLVDKKAAGIGHNSDEVLTGEKNPEAIKLITELMEFQDKKKAIAKAERDVRNKLKSQFKILASSVAREVALRKLDPDVRVQVETNHEDFKKLLGYQANLDFVNGLATEASQKAQPSERSTEPKRGGVKRDEEGYMIGDEDKNPAASAGEDGEGTTPSNVITREG